MIKVVNPGADSASWWEANGIPPMSSGIPVLVDLESRLILWHQLATPAGSTPCNHEGHVFWPSVFPNHLRRFGLEIPGEDSGPVITTEDWDDRASSQLGVLRATPLIVEPPAEILREAL